MKRGYRALSFILVLSLLFSSFVFTASAADTESSGNSVGDYIDENVELFTPSANYTTVTEANVSSVLTSLLVDGTETDKFGPVALYGGYNVDAHLVSSDAYADYLMILPTETAIQNGKVTDHVQINTYVNETLTYDSANPGYYVFEMDVATESGILPIYYQIVSRNADGVTDENGSTISNWGSAWNPHQVTNSLYMTMTPGVFHHMTFVGDIDNNVMYVYMNNQLVIAQSNGVTSELLNSYYKNNGATLKIEGMRIQLSGSIALSDNTSYCMKDIYEKVLTGTESDNLSDYVGKPTLQGWTGNRYESHNDDLLPPIISVNDVYYNNTVDASAALNAYRESNIVKVQRAVLSGDITVDCDATIYTYSTGVSFVAGEHTTLTKVDGSTYSAKLHSLKYSNKLIESNPSNSKNLAEYLKYNLEGNIITSIHLNNAGLTDGVNADIMQSDKGNQYIYVYDNSENAYEGSHFYMNASIPHTSSNAIAGHDFIVFDFDIFAESELINVYNGFIPRSLTNEAPLAATSFFLTSNLDGTMSGNNYIQIESGIWNHFTFVGEVSTGKAYVYINNNLVKTITNGLYTPGTDADGNAAALDAKGNAYALEDVTINMFRCMQISSNASNVSGTSLTTNMSVGADNFDARFVDGDASLVAGMETLDSWQTNLYGNGYQFPELPPIATVDGVDYYDTLSLTEALTDTDYSTTKKRVIFCRDFVGTVNVSCRATIDVKGVDGNIVYSDKVWTTTTQDSYGTDVVEVYYVETADTDAYTKEWTEDVTGTFENQKLTAATGDTIYDAIASSDSANKYLSHAIGTASGVSWLAQQLKSYTADSNGVYTAAYDDNLYLFDSGAQTHTLNIGTSVASDVSTSNVNATASASGGTVGQNVSATTTFSCTVTENQYYFTLELDIAYSGTLDSSKSEKLTFTFNNTSFDIDLTTILASQNSGEFVHITVVGTVDTTTTITTSATYSVTRSGNIFSYTYTDATGGASATASNTYDISYDVYVNGTKNDTASGTKSLSTNAVSTWSNVSITNSGNNIAVDNVFANTECVTKVWNLEKSNTTSNSEYKTAVSTAGSNVTGDNNKITTETLTNTTAASDNSSDATLDDTLTNGSVSYDASSLPSSVVTGDTEEVVVEIVEKSEEVPAVNTPIACVNGTLYYAADEDALRELLANADGDTEVLEVMILREPDTAYTIGANAVIDTNGLSSNVINYDSSKEFSTTTNSDGSTTVIVVGETTILATLNGTDYYTQDELQTALALSKSATLEFYSQPASALKITCPTVITTNGFTDLYAVDEYVYTASEADGVITISEQTATPTIRLIMNGVEVINEAVVYGTDIANYLKENGIVSAAVAVDGKIYTDVSYTSTVSSYLVDGKPTGRITEDVTFSATYTTEWTEDYIVVDTSGNVVDVATYDTDTLLTYFAKSTTQAIILGADIVLNESSIHSTASSGEVSLYLNGYTVTYDAPSGSSGTHLWVFNAGTDTSADYNFYGPGTIESTTMNNTQGIVYSGIGYDGTVKFKDLTINTSHAVAQFRGGNVEMIGCDINAYIPTTNGGSSVGLGGLFSLGEDYEKGCSNTDISLILSECDLDFRYYEIVGRYANRSLDIPLIYNKIVTSADEASRPKITVLIDNSNVTAQGSLVKSYDTYGGTAPESSNMKLWINESTVFARGITAHDIKSKSVIFYEDVRTNIKNVTAVSFVSTLIKTASSDGLLPYLYTSHDYATVTWSDGTTEYWAGGSIPTRSDCKFDNVEIVEAGKSYTFTSTATAAPFKLYANLTLSDVIGFNIYIPSDQSVSAVYLDGKLVNKGTTSAGEDVTYVSSAGMDCYFYSVAFDPQEAAKQFTLVIELTDGTHVSRTISVGTYAAALYKSIKGKTDRYSTRNSALLSVALDYIEQAAVYSGYNLDMTDVASTLSGVGVTTLSESATTTDTSAIKSYIGNVQLNIKDTGAFRFNAADGINLNDLTITFTVDGVEKIHTVSADGSYAELSLRAYEMAKTIEITIEESTGTYDLYTYYASVKNAAGTGDSAACAYNQALQLVEALYTYALVADEQLNANPNE